MPFYTGATTVSTPSTLAWLSWNASGSTTTTITTGTGECWLNWLSSTTTTSIQYASPRIYAPPRSAEEERRRSEVALRYTKEREAAELRAEDFMLRNLTPVQRAMYLRAREFIALGRKHRYRIKRRDRVAILRADDSVSDWLCCHPYHVPACDVMLTQKLMLECPETERLFLHTANRTEANAQF